MKRIKDISLHGEYTVYQLFHVMMGHPGLNHCVMYIYFFPSPGLKSV